MRNSYAPRGGVEYVNTPDGLVQVSPAVEDRPPRAIADRVFAYEAGKLDPTDTLELFAELVETGMAWALQGSYGRAAADMVSSGYLLPDGTITQRGRDAVER